MMRWFNEERMIFTASMLLFGAMIWYAQNGWKTVESGGSGSGQLSGAGGQQTVQDSFAIAFLADDFTQFSFAAGRNIFEPLDKMLPMPPVQLRLPSLPLPKVLANLPEPNPPSTGQQVCMLDAATTWEAAGASVATPTGLEEPEDQASEDADEGADEGAEDGADEGAEDGAEGDPDPETPEGAPEPGDTAWDDPRVRPFATIVFKSGKERSGTVIRELPDSIVVESTGEEKLRTTYQRRDLDKIIPAMPLEQLIRGDFEGIKKTDDARYLKLLERCLARGAPPAVTAVAEEWGLRICRDAIRRQELYVLLADHFRSRFDIERQLQVYEAARDATGGLMPVELVADYADVLEQVGLPALARTVVEAGLLRKRNDDGLKLRLARHLVASAEYEQAATLVQSLGPAALAKPEVTVVLARALYLAGQFAEAREQLIPITANPESAYPPAMLLLGTCHLVLKDASAARGAYEALMASSTASADLRAMASYNLGVIAELELDPVGAQSHFGAAVQLDPTNPNPHLGMGFVAELAGSPEVAAEAYRKALATTPRLGYAHLGLGRVDERTLSGDAAYEGPRSNYQLAFVEDFELTDAVARLGYLAAKAGDSGAGHQHYYEALDYLAEAARRLPTDALLRLEIAHCHIALAELDRAETALQDVQALDQENSDAIAGIAYVRNASGAERRALADLEKLTKRQALRAELAEFARAGAAAISTNLGRWRWVDSFNRTGDVPRREWIPVGEVGVRVYLDAEAGVVRFAGKQSSDAPDAPSRLERVIDPKTFVSFKAKVDTSGAGKALACVSMRVDDDKRPIEFLWGRTQTGQLAWKLTGSPQEAEWNVISAYPDGDVHELEVRVETGQGKARYFILAIDGVVLRDETAAIKSAQLTAVGAKNIRVGVCGAAAAFDEYRLSVDDVELVEERPGK